MKPTNSKNEAQIRTLPEALRTLILKLYLLLYMLNKFFRLYEYFLISHQVIIVPTDKSKGFLPHRSSLVPGVQSVKMVIEIVYLKFEVRNYRFSQLMALTNKYGNRFGI